MEDVERALRELPLRTPSRRLDARIGALFRAEETPAEPSRPVRVGGGVAAAACIVAGVLGFVAGRTSAPRADLSLSERSPARVRVVFESSRGPNPFDLTRSEASGSGEWRSQVRFPKGESR